MRARKMVRKMKLRVKRRQDSLEIYQREPQLEVLSLEVLAQQPVLPSSDQALNSLHLLLVDKPQFSVVVCLAVMLKLLPQLEVVFLAIRQVVFLEVQQLVPLYSVQLHPSSVAPTLYSSHLQMPMKKRKEKVEMRMLEMVETVHHLTKLEIQPSAVINQ